MAIRMRRLMPVVPGREAWEERGMAPQGTRRGTLPLHSPRYPIFISILMEMIVNMIKEMMRSMMENGGLIMIQFSFQGFLIVMLNEGIIMNKI